MFATNGTEGNATSFHQIGVEHFILSGPGIDAELIT